MKKNICAGALLVAFASFTFFACTKTDDKNAAVITDAIVYNSGAVASDGCGWIIKIPATDSTYSPVNLSDSYKINNLKIHVRYHPLSTKFTCGWGTKLREISIDNIARSN